jgi:glucosamine-6-phosphate deaminase
MDRRNEIRALLRMTPGEMLSRAGGRLRVEPDLDTLHARFAEDLFAEIASNNRAGRPTRLIVPVGPTGQYPVLLDLVHRERLSLRRCFLFFMDEYCDESGVCVAEEHPLSFRGCMKREFFARLDPELAPPPEQVVFPGEANIDRLAATIAEGGGIDTCYGGVGIHGHVAFNEPEPGVADTGPRKVRLNDFTVTINAVRAEAGGNLEGFPRWALTLGMRQILAARRIRLYIRNGTPYDWANTVLRLALFGTPGDDYPVTHIRGRNYEITTDAQTAAPPRNIL